MNKIFLLVLIAFLLILPELYAATTTTTTVWRACGFEAECGVCPDPCFNQCLTCPSEAVATGGGRERPEIVDARRRAAEAAEAARPPAPYEARFMPKYPGPNGCRSYEECHSVCGTNTEKCERFIMKGPGNCSNALECSKYCAGAGSSGACKGIQLFGSEALKTVEIKELPEVELPKENQIMNALESKALWFEFKNNEDKLVDYTATIVVERNGLPILSETLYLRSLPDDSLQMKIPRTWMFALAGNYLAKINLKSPQAPNFSYIEILSFKVLGELAFEVNINCGKRVLKAGEEFKGKIEVVNSGSVFNNLAMSWELIDERRRIVAEEEWIEAVKPEESAEKIMAFYFPRTQPLGKHKLTVTAKADSEIQQAQCEIFIEAENTYYERTLKVLNEDLQKLKALLNQQKISGIPQPIIEEEVKEIEVQVNELEKRVLQNKTEANFSRQAEELFTRINTLITSIQALDRPEQFEYSDFAVVFLGVIIIMSGIMLIWNLYKSKGLVR